MGIVNVTADSFSGDGILGLSADRSFEVAQDMARAGADILDVGGESSRPAQKKYQLKRRSQGSCRF